MKLQFEDGRELAVNRDSIGYYYKEIDGVVSGRYPNIEYNIDPIAIVRDKLPGFFYIGDKDNVFVDDGEGGLIFDPEQVTKVVLVSKVVSFTELHVWETKA